ncbi:MAG: hypothetical protein AUK63_1964, partial [bacterium P3]
MRKIENLQIVYNSSSESLLKKDSFAAAQG